MTDLSHRCEQASADQQRTMLHEAYIAIYGSAPDNWPREAASADKVHGNRFVDMVNAEAYLDAAMILVLDGWDSIEIRRTDDMEWHVSLAKNDMHMMAEDPDEYYVEANECKSAALALTAAALRSRNDG